MSETRLMRNYKSSSQAFTLIELLVVVAILAILAAIAVPNFLQAQTRAKVSRVYADLYTVATALDAYRIDYNGYVLNDGNYNVISKEISTPVAYLTTANLIDPFSSANTSAAHGDLEKYYSYHMTVSKDQAIRYQSIGRSVSHEDIDAPGENPGAFLRYGGWKILSNGPDRSYAISPKPPAGPYNPNPDKLIGVDIPYDPTNGTVSVGNIHRTQKLQSPPGIVP
ncbi:MAG: prepilin-type N-terminal cleavage/methylation domain-containing protein [Candidatus Sumerlaeota bacterium]